MRILVLSGGGSNGAFQIGALEEMYDQHGSKYDAIFGVSTGALTGAVLAQSGTYQGQLYNLAEVAKVYRGIESNSDIYTSPKLGIVGKAWALFKDGGLYNPKPLKKLIEKYVDPLKLERS